METRTINLGAANTSVLIQTEGDFVSIRSATGLVTLTPRGSQKPASPDQKNVLEYTGVFSGASDGLSIVNLSAGYAAKIGRYTSIAISSTVLNDTVELQVGYGWVDNRDISSSIIVPPSPYRAQSIENQTINPGQSVTLVPLLDYKFLILNFSCTLPDKFCILVFDQNNDIMCMPPNGNTPTPSFLADGSPIVVDASGYFTPTASGVTIVVPVLGGSSVAISNFYSNSNSCNVGGQFTNNWNT
jgi:hypothetical protein